MDGTKTWPDATASSWGEGLAVAHVVNCLAFNGAHGFTSNSNPLSALVLHFLR